MRIRSIKPTRRALLTQVAASKIRAHATCSLLLTPDRVDTWADLRACTDGHRLVYRFRDNVGGLLYVGVTANPKERWKHHRKTKGWWPEVATVEIECHVSDYDAHAVEYSAIRIEGPMHNRHGAVTC